MTLPCMSRVDSQQASPLALRWAAHVGACEQSRIRTRRRMQFKLVHKHCPCLQAWMRSRGEAGTATLTAESMAERYGVVKGTYSSVPLPRIQAYTVGPDKLLLPSRTQAGAQPCLLRSLSGQSMPVLRLVYYRCACCMSSAAQVRCERAGQPGSVLRMAPEALPPALEWQEVLVSMQAAPISPADLFAGQAWSMVRMPALLSMCTASQRLVRAARTGGTYGSSQAELPYVAGMDGVGMVAKVRQQCLESQHLRPACTCGCRACAERSLMLTPSSPQ